MSISPAHPTDDPPVKREYRRVPGFSDDYQFVYVDYLDPIAVPLLDDLTREYDERYGEFHGQSASVEIYQYPAERFAPPNGAFLLLLKDGEPISGGAFMPKVGTTAEVKRVWTHIDARGKGLAKVVLNELELRAIQLGYTKFFLTTGPRQPEARALYLKHGYTPLFDTSLTGEEIGGPLPFEKELVGRHLLRGKAVSLTAPRPQPGQRTRH